MNEARATPEWLVLLAAFDCCLLRPVCVPPQWLSTRTPRLFSPAAEKAGLTSNYHVFTRICTGRRRPNQFALSICRWDGVVVYENMY
jgi:hypothetical protein